MIEHPVSASLDAAPSFLRPALATFACELAAAIQRFGQACERLGTHPEMQATQCVHIAFVALAVVERDMRLEGSLHPFRAEAFAQRALTAALDVIGDEAALQPMRSLQ